MRRAALVVAGIAVVAMAISGCGTKVPGVPGTVARVNGKGISASTYLDQVSRRVGQDVLRNLIEQQIIVQWADEEKTPATKEQVQKQIDILKRDGAYDDQVKMMGEDNLKSEIEAAQARINLARKFTKIAPQQLQQVYDSMKQRYIHGKRKQILAIINPDSIKLEEALKKIKEGKDFDEVAAEYTDRRFSMRGPIKVWVDLDQPAGMPAAIVKAAKDTKMGEVSDVVSFGQPNGPTQSAILKVAQEQPKENKALKDVKPEVESMAALQNSQMDPVFARKLNSQLKAAKVEVDIKEFKDLVYSFKNPPEPSPMMMPQRQAAPRPNK